MPSAAAFPASIEVRLPLKESIAITVLIISLTPLFEKLMLYMP
jgi:hypothetical protein